MSWHRPVRIAVGVFGLSAAVVVYFAIGPRRSAAPALPIERLDPTAALESTKAVLQQAHRSEEDFEVRADRTLNYNDGSAKLLGVRVSVKKRNGRDFVVTAREAGAGKDRKDLKLTGDVVLEASDGFRLTTADATYSDGDGMVRAPGRVEFTNGGMTGGGLGMTYDKNNDVLTLLTEAAVVMAPSEGAAGTSFKSGTAVLDRLMDVLVLSGGAHAERGEQTFEAATITARLADDERYVRAIEMRGSARVAGGGGTLDAMSAEAIDLSYVEGGEMIDRVTLTGDASAALTSQASQSGRRQVTGGVIDLQLGPDGSLVHAGGREGIRFDLPASERSRANSILARSFDANGAEGAGLTSATFVDDVQFKEEGSNDSAPRAARSRRLEVSLAQDEVSDATFRGNVMFEDRGLAACAAQVRYQPRAGSIDLSGVDAGGGPRASDERVAIAADAIGVTLQGTNIAAHGGVKTVLRPTREARGTCLPRLQTKGRDAGAPPEEAGKLPALLKQDTPVNVNADKLAYAGAGGAAVYTGNATLWQGDTSIRADELRLDQDKGDFVANGNARATLQLGGQPSSGKGDVIRFEDARHLVTYEMRQSLPAGGGRSGRGTTASRGRTAAALPPQAFVSGPQGALRARRIEMVLSSDGSKTERLEAYGDVDLRVDTRRGTGDRLTYFAQDERYVLTGSAAAPVCVLDPNRAMTGRTLVFYRSADRILVDGNEETRTQTKSGGACAPSPAR